MKVFGNDLYNLTDGYIKKFNSEDSALQNALLVKKERGRVIPTLILKVLSLRNDFKNNGKLPLNLVECRAFNIPFLHVVSFAFFHQRIRLWHFVFGQTSGRQWLPVAENRRGWSVNGESHAALGDNGRLKLKAKRV